MERHAWDSQLAHEDSACSRICRTQKQFGCRALGLHTMGKGDPDEGNSTPYLVRTLVRLPIELTFRMVE